MSDREQDKIVLSFLAKRFVEQTRNYSLITECCNVPRRHQNYAGVCGLNRAECQASHRGK